MANPRNATTTNRGRFYNWRDEQFTSVTTILGAIAKPALTGWAAKSVAEYVAENFEQVAAIAKTDKAAAIDLMKGSPWRQRDAAADIGTQVHEAAERHLLGVPQPEFPAAIAPRLGHFLQFLADYQVEVLCSECTVYNRKHVYAGTLDILCEIGDRTGLIDIKSGKAVYPEAALQNVAYKNAEFIGTPDGYEEPMPAVDFCAVLHITPGYYSLVPCVSDDAMFRTFLYAAEVHRFLSETSKTCLGAPLSPADCLDEVVA